MYIPRHFRCGEPETLYRLISDYPLATLVTSSPEGPIANHVPLLLDAAGADGIVLRGHIARANPLARQLEQAQSALAIFTGPDSYITPGWYPAKAVHGKVVPTWNYTAVHARGSLHLIDDAEWLAELLRALTQRQEGAAATPWSVEDAPAEYIRRLSAAIVGIEMVVETLEGKWKVSQNQDAATRAAVAAGLRERGRGADMDMAALVESALAE